MGNLALVRAVVVHGPDFLVAGTVADKINFAFRHPGNAAAEAEAKKNNWTVAIAIVDSSARLVAFSKMDGTQHASVDIAIGKAVTANNLKRPTKALQDSIAQGGVGLRILGQPGITPLEGGVPIVVDGKIVGAIGASGVMSNQDAEVAMAGAAAAAAK